MHDLDFNYIYWLITKAENENDSNQRRNWLESAKDHISYMDMKKRGCNPCFSGTQQHYYTDVLI